jgi:hypothetical protein
MEKEIKLEKGKEFTYQVMKMQKELDAFKADNQEEVRKLRQQKIKIDEQLRRTVSKYEAFYQVMRNQYINARRLAKKFENYEEDVPEVKKE